MALTKVEQYLIDKGWDFYVSGDQAVVELCPFCGKDGYKFYINIDSWGWDCKKGSCNQHGGEWKLKIHMGDKVEEVNEEVVSEKRKRGTEMEAVPSEQDLEQMHKWLLESDDLMNYLNDERGWNFDTVKRMKLGITKRWVADQQAEVGCWIYPYYIGGKCQFAKYRTLPGIPRGFSSLSGRPVPLYNQDAIKKGMDYLLLVEGEPDTISVLNLGEENVVGVPGSTLKQVTWSDLLQYPGKKYLLFDNDEAGQTGAKAFAERFGIDQFYNIVLPEFDLVEPIEEDGETRTKGKDITEWIQTGKTKADLNSLVSSASLFNLDGVSSVRKSLAELKKEMVRRGDNKPEYDSPWESLNKLYGGSEKGQLIILQAPQKTGKTSMCLNWGQHLVDKNQINVHFECLEMPDTDLARKWASFMTLTDDSPGKSSFEEVLKMLDEAEGKAKEREFEMTFGYPKLESLEGEFERLRSVVRRTGAKALFFDNLQFLVDRVYTGERQGGRPAFISRVTKMFKSLAMEMKILVILIAQTRGIGEDDVANSTTLEGSRSPANDCDTMMIMNRTKSMKVDSKDDLDRLAAMGENTVSTQTLNPELFIEVGLSRFAPGGLCVLMIDGSRSLVYERTADEMKAKVEANADRVGDMKVVRAKKEAVDAPAMPMNAAPQFNTFNQNNEEQEPVAVI